MTTVIIIIVIILLISLAASSKKNTKVPNMPSDSFSINSREPSSEGLRFAHKYFGQAWQSWLVSQVTSFELPKNFHDTIAFALENLTAEENNNLMRSFLKVSSSSDLSARGGINISVGFNNYDTLYLETFNLLKTGRFSEISMTKLLKQIATKKMQQRTEGQKQERDDSVIDVTGKSYQIKTETEFDAPYWEHQYVYSYSEINNATPRQKKFYSYYKEKFINGIYLDLNGNSNYCFILLFDLLEEYGNHKDYLKIEQQLQNLGHNYPLTKRYLGQFLFRKMREIGEEDKIEILEDKESPILQILIDESRLGNIYKKRLELSKQEVAWLNKFWNPNNVFISIEGCCIQTIKLYLSTLKELNSQLNVKGSTIGIEVGFFQNEVLNLYQSNNDSYWGYDNTYLKERVETEVFLTIFKRAENAVREVFGHKRKISGDFPYANQPFIQEFENRLGLSVNQTIQSLTSSIPAPDEKTEEDLNAQNVSRWKIQFDKLEKSFTEKAKQKFIDGISQLERVNQKNPSIENIFFEASKFIAKFDKTEALKFYILYLYYDLNSVRIDNKQLTKTIQKNLFKTNEQLHDFEKIIADLVKSKNIKTALTEVVKIYQPKRKKIQLDISAIKEVQQQDKGTVELLNEYLQDEFEDENTTVKTKEINNEEIMLEIVTKSREQQSSTFVDEISLNENQAGVIALFAENCFSLPFSDVDAFCKSKGIFKNHLIDSINESCFEVLDDVLIEEDGDNYTLNETYYKKISSQ